MMPMKRPEIDPRTLEALEACRPGSEDLSDPVMASLVSQMAASRELDDLYERLQKFDASLASAYQDVPVPEGLAERILAHLDASQEGPLATSCTPPLPSSGAMTEALSGVQVPDASLAASLRQVSGRSSQRILRRWLVGGGLVSAAVIVTGIVCWVGLRARDRQIAADQAIRVFLNEHERGQHEPGTLLVEQPPPADYPASDFVSLPSSTRWRYVLEFQGARAVAYDLASSQGAAATLYVLRGRAVDLPSTPPSFPELNTQRCAVGRWQDPDAGVVYVLVVEGGETEYRQFLQSGDGPIT